MSGCSLTLLLVEVFFVKILIVSMIDKFPDIFIIIHCVFCNFI